MDAGRSARHISSHPKRDYLERVTLRYSADELEKVPEGMLQCSFGCGNPVRLADISLGEAVVDLGSGTGLDCLLAAHATGRKGKVTGVDVNEERLQQASAYLQETDVQNVEFLTGTIEEPPIEDQTADVVISNCALTHASDKDKALSNAFRVLKPGGRIVVCDVALMNEWPPDTPASVREYLHCLAHADVRENYLERFARAGFSNEAIVFDEPMSILEPHGDLPDMVRNIAIKAIKPA